MPEKPFDSYILWTLRKSGHTSSCRLRHIERLGVEGILEHDGEWRQSQMFMDHSDPTPAPARAKAWADDWRRQLEEVGWGDVS